MSIPIEMKPNVYSIRANHWDRRLFDEIIPLPDGTSYNTYLIAGSEKTALIDTVDPSMSGVLFKGLNRLDIKNIDYIVANHAEQDHSGTLPDVLNHYPDANVIATPKCKEMLIDLLAIPDNKIIPVEDGKTLSLGDKTLQFIHFPWVHWPETMFTYLQEDKLLFTCDFFGSHLATSDLYVTDEATVYEAAKRYYAEIMMPFRKIINKNFGKLDNLEIDQIPPSHGPVYDKPSFIMDAYRDWLSEGVKNQVLIPYISMHDSTRIMVDYLIDALTAKGITVFKFNLSKTDVGKLAISLVDAATIVLGSPTFLVGPHPEVAYAATLTNALRPKTKFASIIGSYEWGGKMSEQIQGLIANLKLELLQPVVVKGLPKNDDFSALDQLADEIYTKHKELGLMD